MNPRAVRAQAVDSNIIATRKTVKSWIPEKRVVSGTAESISIKTGTCLEMGANVSKRQETISDKFRDRILTAESLVFGVKSPNMES